MNDQPAAAAENKSVTDRFVGVAALMLALVFVAYWPALRGEFVWDDLLTVHKNPLVTGQFNLLTLWFQSDFPLTTIALWVQWLLWEKNPAGYHVVNVLLHTANVFLLWRLLNRLKIRGAFWAAVMFAVHPVAVMSVAWISELKNTLSLCFCLLSFLFFLRSTDEAPVSGNGEAGANLLGRRKNYWAAIGFFVLALFSKTSVVVLPVVILLIVWWQKGRVGRNDLLWTLPFLALALAFGLMTVWFQQAQVIRGDTVQTENFWGRLATAGISLWFYLYKALLPVNLSMIYPRWAVDSGSVLAYVPLILFIAVLATCWWFRRTWARHVFFGLACFVVTLFPVLGFFDVYYFAISRVSDHFQYLPLIAIVTLVAAGLHRLLGEKNLKVAASVLVVVLAALTFLRAGVFKTEEALWRDTLKKYPESWNAHNNLACILAEQGQIQKNQEKMAEAMREFEESLKYNPRNTKALCNLGRGLMMRGQLAEAEKNFQAALKIKSDDVDAHTFYAQLLAGTKRVPQAIEHLREAIRIRPEVETRLLLAQMLVASGKKSGAAEEYRRVLAAKPDTIDALSNLAFILATCSDEKVRNGNEAVRFAERAVSLTDGKHPMALSTLAAAYAEAGRFPDAVATCNKAMQVANAAGNAQVVGINQQLLRLYAAGRPYHEAPPNVTTPP